jgi:hypothetical protein
MSQIGIPTRVLDIVTNGKPGEFIIIANHIQAPGERVLLVLANGLGARLLREAIDEAAASAAHDGDTRRLTVLQALTEQIDLALA